jgi:hypothetical protein
MNIVVLNGSPKRGTSVTMLYVRYVQELFPQHDLQIVHIAPRINALERNTDAFQDDLGMRFTGSFSFPQKNLVFHS